MMLMPNQPWVWPAPRFQPSVGQAEKSRHTSPYTPIPVDMPDASMTCGSLGSRSSTGGSVPLATSASIHAA